MDDIVTDVRANNISVTSQQLFLRDPSTQIKNLKVQRNNVA